MGKRLRDALPVIPKDMMIMNNPMVNPAWRDLWSKKEAVMQDRYLKDLEGPPATKSHLQPLTEHTKVLIQNQTGKAPLKWDKTGVIVEVMPFDQYIVKVHGSNRLTRKNRKFLRAYVPALEEEEPSVPYGRDIETDREEASAWGARGQRNQSADSHIDDTTDSDTRTQDTNPPENQDVRNGADLNNSVGERNPETDRPDTPSHSQKLGPQCSTRT